MFHGTNKGRHLAPETLGPFCDASFLHHVAVHQIEDFQLDCLVRFLSGRGTAVVFSLPPLSRTITYVLYACLTINFVSPITFPRENPSNKLRVEDHKPNHAQRRTIEDM